jgi:hypothetical protein
MVYLANSYQDGCAERQGLIQAYESYLDFIIVFRKKAVGDSVETMKKQHIARLELDSYGSKLGNLEEKKLKTFARAAPVESSLVEKDLETTRSRFQVILKINGLVGEIELSEFLDAVDR